MQYSRSGKVAKARARKSCARDSYDSSTQKRVAANADETKDGGASFACTGGDSSTFSFSAATIAASSACSARAAGVRQGALQAEGAQGEEAQGEEAEGPEQGEQGAEAKMNPNAYA